MTEPTQIADGTFPPPTISRWVRWQTISLEALVAELRYWADHYEVMQEEQRHHA